MPVFIGDVLESSGGPVLDIETRQIRGLGIFSSNDQRDELEESLRVKGYISYTDSTLSVYNEVYNDSWQSTLNWKNVLCDRGFAVDVDYEDSGNFGTDHVGFLIAGDSATVDLYPGDVFHIRGVHDGNSSTTVSKRYLTIDSDSNFGTPISDGSYYVAEACNPSRGSDIPSVLDALYDFVRSGKIVPLHSGRVLIDRHTQLTESNVQSLTGDDSVAAAILGDEGKILVSAKDGGQRAKDFSLTVNQFISLLAIGIAEENVSNGYGDYSSYGGVAGETYSAGDINGDGLVSVADLLILLGNFGNVPESSFLDTVVTFGNLSGNESVSNASAAFDEDRYVADEGSRTYMHRDFASNGEAPTVTQGGATVYIVNTANSTTDLEATSSPPGDMVIFSGTEATGFDINAFGANAATNTKLYIEEPSGTSVLPDVGFRNFVNLTDVQEDVIINFKAIARVRRFSSAEALPSVSDYIIDDKEVILGTYSLGTVFSSNFFFNLTSGPTNTLGLSQTNLSALYASQHGTEIFANSGSDSVLAVGVQVGFRFEGSSIGTGTNFNHSNHGFNDLVIRCKPHS